MTKSQYLAVHNWLRVQYGRPDRCESKTCKGTSHRYEWALRSGKFYAKNRKNYMRLCQTCHRQYDKKHNNYLYARIKEEETPNVSIDKPVHRLLKIRAAQEGFTMSEMIERLLKLKV